ncbi:hypothetical protein JTE90_000775, partial [Oedothorax gibbosus]
KERSENKMADENAALENLKKEIRSVLLPFKEGCTLFMFQKEYKSLIGRAIPAQKFGYSDDIHFLQSIPDVVDIYQQGNEYHLMAVADEATWHIQKMVAHQKKPAKCKSAKSVRKYSQSSRYVTRSTYGGSTYGGSTYGGSRQSTYSSKPPTRHPSGSASNTQAYGSSQQPADNNFSWGYTGTSNSTSVPNSTSSTVRNTAVSNGQSSANVPASNGQSYVNRPASNGQSYVNRPASNGQSSVNRPVSNEQSSVNRPVSNGQSSTNRPVSNGQSSTNRPVSNGQSSSNRPTLIGDNPTSWGLSNPTSTTNVYTTASAVGNHAPVRQPEAASTPSHFVSNSSPAQTTQVASTKDSVANTSSSFNFSRQFQKNLPPRFHPRSTTSSTTLLPPEVECKIVDVVRKFSHGLKMKDFFAAYQRNFNEEFSLKKHDFSTLQECLETIADLSLRPSNNDFIISYEGHRATQRLQQSNQPSGPIGAGAWANTPSSGTQAQAQSHYSSTSQLQNTFKPNLEPASFNFQEQSQTYKKPHYNKDLALPNSLLSEDHKSRRSRADALDNFELNDLKVSSLGLTEQMKSKFREIISRNKQGIQARDFPLAYESVTGSQFDLHSLGYTDLADLVDSMPDIMHRRKVEGSRKDWLIIPASGCQDPGNKTVKGQPQKAALQIECCIQYTKILLEAYSEGIPLSDFLSVYSINCNEPLYIVDLGFDNIENFLLSISDRVPLMIKAEKGVKTIFLNKVKAEAMLRAAELPIQEDILPESIPFDAASPDCEYKKQALPLDSGTSNFFEIYTSHIDSPVHIFIQLKSDKKPEPLQELQNELEKFYNGPNSDFYMVQDRHIKVGAMCASLSPKGKFYNGPNSDFYMVQDRHLKVGAMCASLWPKDSFWYRARIVSVKSPEIVRVCYVDYGTSDDVPITLLRYLKESFSKLPAQAIRAGLAHIEPPNREKVWNPAAKQRMLELCRDQELLAKVVYKKDDVLYLEICNISKEKEEIYINDALLEGFADSITPDPEPTPLKHCQVPIVDPQTIEDCLYQAMTKAITDLRLNYPGALPNHLLSGYATGQSAFGTMPNQTSAGIASGQSMFGVTNNRLIPGSSTYQSPSISTAGQPSLETMANQHQLPGQSMLGTVNYQNFPASFQSPSRIGSGQPSFDAVANPAGMVAGNMPPGFSAIQSSAGAGQLYAGTMNNQFPPGFAPYQPFAGAASGLNPQPNGQSSDSTDESDFFGDDDDEDFDEFMEKASSVSKRYVKRIHTEDGYLFHILIVDEQLYVSSGDLSTLIWCLNEPDYLLTTLQSNDTIFESRSIFEEGNETMFHQFEQFHIKGIQRGDETGCLIIYPLHSTMRILNEYGHPSIELRQHIKNEMESFNPNLPFWQELSEMEIPDPNETFPAMSDEEKDNKRCLYELKHAKEGIRVRMDQLKKIMSKSKMCAVLFHKDWNCLVNILFHTVHHLLVNQL